MDKKITYQEQNSRDNTIKLRQVLATLPSFTKDFFRAIEPNTSAKTRISYVYDIRVFFQFLCENIVLEIPLQFTKVKDLSKFHGDGWKLIREDELTNSNNPFSDLLKDFKEE